MQEPDALGPGTTQSVPGLGEPSRESSAGERARPPVLEAGAWEMNTKTLSKITDHKFFVGEGVVLLCDSEDVSREILASFPHRVPVHFSLPTHLAL